MSLHVAFGYEIKLRVLKESIATQFFGAITDYTPYISFYDICSETAFGSSGCLRPPFVLTYWFLKDLEPA